MAKHVLFLLKPGFYSDKGGPFYCPDTAAVEGFLKFSPEIENRIDVRRIDFPKPRREIVDLIGDSNQGCPVLVLDEAADVPDRATKSEDTGKVFISDITLICDFLGQTYGAPRPHP